MSKQRKAIQILAFILVTSMILTVFAGFGVSTAEENPNPTTPPTSTGSSVITAGAKGSIHVTKYATTDDVSNVSGVPGKGTGTTVDGTTVGNMKDDTGKKYYTPLDGAEFTLYKVADENYVMNYYNGKPDTSVTVDTFLSGDNVVDETENTVNGDLVGITGSDGNNSGEYTFTNLDIGFYVLKETTPPSQIAINDAAETTLISIPMVNTATSNNGNTEWIYNVHVYPKNIARKGEVTITKQGELSTDLIDGVTFNLYKKDFNSNGEFDTNSTWTQVGATGTTDSSDENKGKVTFSQLTAGPYGTQYMIIEDTAPNGYIADRTPMYFTINRDKIISWNAASEAPNGLNNTNVFVSGTPSVDESTLTKLSIALTNKRPSLEKSVLANGKTIDNAAAADWKNDSEYRLDDTITYKITVHVPKDITSMPTFTVTDTPDIGITDDSSTITVACDSVDNAADKALVIGRNYTVSGNSVSNKGTGFTVAFVPSSMDKYADKDVTIIYTAKMNANAKIGTEGGNDNTATLTYSTKTTPPTGVPAQTADSSYTISDSARVVTYKFELTKYKDRVADGNEIENVEFELYDNNASTATALNVVGSAGSYRLAVSTDSATSTTTTLKTDSNGKILIKGLENGYYYLKEIKTIDGYNLLSDKFKITVQVKEETVWSSNSSGWGANGWTAKTAQSTTYSDDCGTATDATCEANIINKQGFVLPQTGSMGYLLFCTAGIVMILGGTVLLLSSHKKKIR